MAVSYSVGIPDIDSVLDRMGGSRGIDPSDPAGLEDLRFAQKSLRRMVRSMDRVLGAAEAIAEAGESSNWDRMAIASAIQSWNGQLGKVYKDFAKTRTLMYAMSKSYGISIRRPSVKRKGRQNVYQMTESELEKDLRRLVRALRPALREVAEDGARLLSGIDRILKKPSIGLTQADKLTTQFLDFRDAVGGKMFGMINGIVKRLDARSKLARRIALQAHNETPWYMESRDPRHMSEGDLLAYSEKRDRQRTLGSYALTEDDGNTDVFSHFDGLTERQMASSEPVQRAKDRMAASLARGDTKKMVRDASTRIKRMTNRAKLKGMVTAIGQVLSEPGLGLTSGQKTALKTLQRMASLKLGEGDLADRLSTGLQERGSWTVSSTTEALRRHMRLHEAVARRATVDVFVTVLTSKIVQADKAQGRRDMKRGGMVNIYSLGLMMGVVHKVQGDVRGLEDKDDAVSLEKLKRSITSRFNLVGPVKFTLKAIDKYLASGKMPSIAKGSRA